MANENNSAMNDFLDSLKANPEKKSPLEQIVQKQEPIIQPATEEAEVEEVKEEKLPFYKDPKIQRYIEKQVKKQLILGMARLV